MSAPPTPELAATHAVLHEHFGPGTWELVAAVQGRVVAPYIARSRARNVFVKWDVPGLGLWRLSDPGIVPPVLAAGSYRGRPYFIQQFCDGTHPSPAWFAEHAEHIGSLMGAYHRDAALAEELSMTGKSPPIAPVQDAIETVRPALNGPLPDVFSAPAPREHLEHWMNDTQTIPSGLINAVHLDPNVTNFLITPNQLYLIDWDELTLSDPYRDVGPVLWWYMPEDAWEKFFQAYGLEMTAESVSRVYWWAAHRSMSVALWIAARDPCSARIEEFLTDFQAAAACQPNPRRFND